MNPEIAKLLNSSLPTIVGVFSGSLPLMAVIGWFALQQNDRFKSIEERLGKIETKIDSLTKAVGDLVTEVRLMNQRVVTLENHESQPRIVAG